MKFSFTFLFLLFYAALFSQSSFKNTTEWLSGYSKDVAGETLDYTSAFPDYVNKALLTRANTGQKTIEWQTAPVPANYKGKYIYFRWVAAHSTGTSGGNRNFDFYINNDKIITLTTLPGNKNPRWLYSAADSTAIEFVQLRTDGANDAHGIAYLRVPIAKTTPGKPLQLKIVGHKQESNDWFMTFKYAFEERADLIALPFLLKNGKQPLQLNVLHFGKADQLRVAVNKKQHYTFSLKDGMNTFQIPVIPTNKIDSIHVAAAHSKKTLANQYVLLQPIQKREIHFIHHSHTDIGYSHLQPEVERIHTKNIYDAIQLVEKTKNYPDEAKFKWNIESIWAVENFMKQAAPQDVEKFIMAVKSGGIGLSALYVNMLTGLSMPEEMFHYTDYADSLRKRYGLKIESAMISDVPGFSWSTVTGLAKGGVKYFSSGPNYIGKNNPYLGDRAGHFVKTWGDKPVWWAGPSGKEKVLFWAGGRGYSSWHGMGPGGIYISGVKKIAEYMNDLAAANYPYEIVQWRYNIIADNAPLDSTISDFVKQWNETYASPKIVLNTTEKLFEKFERLHGKNLPVVRGDITPYWEDGAASTANEEGLNRSNSLRLQQLTTLYSMLAPAKYNTGTFYEAWKNILMFHEHTWGAHNSITTPEVPFVTEQWRIKKDFMLQAHQQIDELSKQVLQTLADSNSKKIAVFNTLSWQRSGPVYLPANITDNAVMDEKGIIYPLQKTSDGRKMFIASKLRPLSVSGFYLVNKKKLYTNKNTFITTDSSLSNGIITVTWDRQNGSIKQLLHHQYNYSAIYNHQGMNSYWYVAGREPQSPVTTNSAVSVIKKEGANMASVLLKNNAPGTKELIRKITLLANDDKVYIENEIDKKAVTEKEGVYFAFPFEKNFTKTTYDAGYGTVEYLKDQLAGSNMDFISTRRWLDASAKNKGIQLLMIEPFMMTPNNMVDEKLAINDSYKVWKSEREPATLWFSYVMNNYWHTNYKASQQGITNFRYALRPHEGLNNVQQEKAAMEFTQPLIALPVHAHQQLPQSLLELSNDNIIATSITPHTNGSYKIRLFNPDDKAQSTSIKWISRVMQNTGPISLSAYEVKEIVVAASK